MNHPRPPVHPDRDWRTAAACRNAPDPLVFFPVKGALAPVQTAAAKAICAGCPVIEPCREDALADNLEAGVFGGLTRNERRAIRAARRRAAVQASA